MSKTGSPMDRPLLMRPDPEMYIGCSPLPWQYLRDVVEATSLPHDKPPVRLTMGEEDSGLIRINFFPEEMEQLSGYLGLRAVLTVSSAFSEAISQGRDIEPALESMRNKYQRTMIWLSSIVSAELGSVVSPLRDGEDLNVQ